MDKRSIFFVILLAVSFYFVNQWFVDKTASTVKTEETVVKEEAVQMGSPATAERFTPSETPDTPTEKETFYVLENNTQQLVFSTLGGALVEINLPLASKENPDSVVRSIRFDQIMEEDHAINDHFPANEHYVPSSDGSAPVLKPKGPVGGYYPMLRRSIIGPSGHITHKVNPKYYALNLASNDPEISNLNYQLKSFSKNSIEFESTQNNRRITKTFTLPKDSSIAPYMLDVAIKVEGDARDLAVTTGVPEVELISGSAAPILKYRTFRGEKSTIEKVKLPKMVTTLSMVSPDWISDSNGFMGLILDPISEVKSGLRASYIAGDMIPTRLTLIDAKYNLYPAHKYPGFIMDIPLRPNAQTTHFRYFAGPYDHTILATLDETYSEGGYSPDYAAVQSFDRWFAFITVPFSKFLFFLMNTFHSLTKSWGLSIILLTLALRIMLYPFNAWSFKSMAKMQLISPKVSALQQKYKKDPKRAQMETMALYRENKVNPIMGCLPMLLQLPFLMGMFDLLRSSFDLRGATFIPGWIDNLTAPDILFSWNYPIFFIGTSFHLLPILLGVIMFFQQKITQGRSGKDKVAVVTDQQKQQKMTGNIMVIVFTVIFYNFPSGLNLYWLSSMILGIIQQWYTNKAVARKKA